MGTAHLLTLLQGILLLSEGIRQPGLVFPFPEYDITAGYGIAGCSVTGNIIAGYAVTRKAVTGFIVGGYAMARLIPGYVAVPVFSVCFLPGRRIIAGNTAAGYGIARNR